MNKGDNRGEISIDYKNAISWNFQDLLDSNEKFYPGVSLFRQI